MNKATKICKEFAKDFAYMNCDDDADFWFLIGEILSGKYQEIHLDINVLDSAIIQCQHKMQYAPLKQIRKEAKILFDELLKFKKNHIDII